MLISCDWIGRLSSMASKTNMQDYSISVFYSEEDGGYIADIPDLRFCSAFGETPEEARHEVQIAKAAWLEAAQASDKPIPSSFFKANRTKI